MTPVETLTAAVTLYEQRRDQEPSWTDPVVQAWRALLDRLTRWDAASTALGAVDRAVLASATAYLAGAA